MSRDPAQNPEVPTVARVDASVPGPCGGDVGEGARRGAKGGGDGGSSVPCEAVERALASAGPTEGSRWTSSDVTERRSMVEAIRRYEERYRSMLAAMAEGVVVQAADGRIVECNGSAETILGLTRDQLLGRTSMDPRWRAIRPDGEPFPGDEHPAMVSLRTGESCRGVVMGLVLPSGERRWIQVNAEPISREEGEAAWAVTATFTDITSRVEAEHALQVSEQQLRRLGDNLPGGMIYQLTGDETGRRRFLYLSAGVERIHGVSAEAVSEDPTLLYRQILEEDRPNLEAREKESLEQSAPFACEFRFRRPDGEVRWGLLAAAPSVRADGVIVWDGLELDITERRAMEDRLRESTRMESIARLAGGIAHEFNNTLAAMTMNLELLKLQAAEGEPREMLVELEALTRRSASLVAELLAFSRQSVLERCPVQWAELIERQVESVERMLGTSIRLEVRLPRGLPMVHVDRVLLDQVLLNLCANARDAMPAGGELRLELAETLIGRESAATREGACPGRFVCLSVEDTGCGIDATTLRHLFEPFPTVPGASAGRGLGLAMVYGIVRQHDGWVEVQSRLGQGTTFRVYLPAREPAPAGSSVMVAATEGVRPSVVLLVEDDASLRRVTRTFLERSGYAVLEAGDAGQALELWGSRGAEIDLVFTDLLMPGATTGLDLARQLRREKPALPIVATSGYNAGQIDGVELAGLGIRYLPKPCSRDLLISTLRECLAGAQRGGSGRG